MHKIILKIIQTSGAKIYALLLGMITLSITARYLGPEGRGIVATIVTWMTFLVELGELSLSGAIVYNATENNASDKSKESLLPGMLGTLGFHTFFITLLSWALIALLYFGGHHWDFIPNVFEDTPGLPLLVGFLIMPFALWGLFTRTLLNIEDRLNVFNKYQIIGSTSNSIAVVGLIAASGVGVIGVLMARFLWEGIVAIGGLIELLARKKAAITLNFHHYKDLVIKGLKMHMNMVGAMMLTSIDIIMVSSYLGNEATGIYQLAVQTSLMMMIVPYSVMTVLQGEVTRKGVHGVWPYQKKLLFLTTAFIIVSAIITGLTAKWWLLWLAGEEFKQAIVIFQYLLIWVIVSTGTAILSVQWIARGLFLQLSTASILTGLMNIGLNAALIPKYGIMGAVWATLGTAVLALVINIGMFFWVERDVRRHNRLETENASATS